MRVKSIFRGLALVALLIATASGTLAQSRAYPGQRITIMVGFAAGGSVDSIARVIAEGLKAKWGQPVIVENRPGAGANLAAATVARAAPNGYTLLYTATATAINQFLYAKPGFSIQDLTPVSISTVSTTVIIANAADGPRTLKELIDKHKANGLSVGTSGVGSAGYITGEYFFRDQARISAVMVPFDNGVGSVTALAGNHVDAASVAGSDAAVQIKAGTVRALAVSGAKRSLLLPDVPTFAESGFPDFTSYGWVALFAPAKTDSAIVEKLNTAVNEILSDPGTRKRVEAAGFETNVQSLAWTRQFMADDLVKWGRMVKQRASP